MTQTTATAVDAAGFKPGSLRLRLLMASLAWVVIALLATGVLLVILFRAQMRRHFEDTLRDHLTEIVAAAEAGENGTLRLRWEPADPRFWTPLSGWYWEIRKGADTLKRSPSLLGHRLAARAPGPGQPAVLADGPGPGKARLRIIAQDIVLPESAQAFTVLVAGPCSTVRQDVLPFMGQLAAALGLLGLTLTVLIALQVTYGLKPLQTMRAGLAAVRGGLQTRLDSTGPAEVAPLVEELNGLLDEREAMVARARTEAGDLAHALKTPLAVIRNEAATLPANGGASLKTEADRMARVIEHHLVRARTKAVQRLPGVRASLDTVLEDVRFGLARLYPERSVAMDTAPGLVFAGEADDLGDMIGNLADNAGKWARATIRIRARREGGRLKVTVEDDGPGLGEAECRAVLTRGERLDETTPGHGLGLAIVAQLTGLYGGGLELGRSELGGLAAELDLPAADEGGAQPQ